LVYRDLIRDFERLESLEGGLPGEESYISSKKFPSASGIMAAVPSSG
jgi:hypothetical protein